jgi:hypothetical protein
MAKANAPSENGPKYHHDHENNPTEVGINTRYADFLLMRIRLISVTLSAEAFFLDCETEVSWIPRSA